MKRFTVLMIMTIILIGCAGSLRFYDMVSTKHIIVSRTAVKVYYYDDLEIIFKMNHNRADFILVTWDRANYYEKKKEGWLVYLVESKNDYYDLTDRLGLSADRRSKNG